MLIRHTATYLVGNVISAACGFLSVAVYTRLLTPDEYGTYVLGWTTAGILASLFFNWLSTSLFRYQSEGDHVDVRATALAGYIGSALLLLLTFPCLVFVGGMRASLASVTIMACLAYCFFELSQEAMRARLAAAQVMRSAVLRSLLAFGIGIATVSLSGSGLALLLSLSMAYTISAAVFAREGWSGQRTDFDKETLRRFAILGIPTAASSFVFAVNAGLDRLIVGHVLGTSASGEYGASADLVRQIISLPALSIANAFLPLAVRLLSSSGPEATRDHLSKSGDLLIAVIAPMAVGLAVVSPSLSAVLMGADFRRAAETLIPLLALATFISALSHTYVHASFHLAKRPVLIIAQGLLTCAANLLLMYPLVRSFGTLGAAVSLCISESVGLCCGAILTRRAVALPIRLSTLGRVTAAVGIMASSTLLMRSALGRTDILALGSTVFVGIITYLLAALALNVAEIRSMLARSSYVRVFTLGFRENAARQR